MFEVKTNWWLVLFGLLVWFFLAGCAAIQHPYTEVGVIGYKNVGFEKNIHMVGQYNPETGMVIIESLDVSNDATKAYTIETERMNRLFDLYQANLQMLNNIIQTLITTYGPGTGGQVEQDHRLDKILKYLESKDNG